jgi:hypothetical protein
LPFLTGTSESQSPECVIPDDVLIQLGPPDDEHLLLETCRGINKCVKKECIKLVITQNYPEFFILVISIVFNVVEVSGASCPVGTRIK